MIHVLRAYPKEERHRARANWMISEVNWLLYNTPPEERFGRKIEVRAGKLPKELAKLTNNEFFHIYRSPVGNGGAIMCQLYMLADVE